MSASESFSNRKNIIWVYLSGAMALTFIVLLFLPDSGTGGATLSLYSTMLWCGLFGAALFRYLLKNTWAGFAAGSAIGMMIQIASQVV
ncbi:hypothetical protein HHX48_08495 [Salinimonas sp. HHU 13199]|uniref:Uncharacterized protein n=1 Tax=Salinimonas profundi TaxID=2729140 RepID=A0ABR8LNU2_9ALTE|nr:hypothetical protein [Salinimonas profundi]MBD3585770.1 hypothetical protein [Salinimonas profundi]